jgi:hypothetical protein
MNAAYIDTYNTIFKGLLETATRHAIKDALNAA